MQIERYSSGGPLGGGGQIFQPIDIGTGIRSKLHTFTNQGFQRNEAAKTKGHKRLVGVQFGCCLVTIARFYWGNSKR
jgi:hypothetical protein